MSGETEDNVSGWTVDTLHSHLSRLLSDLDLRFQAQLDAHGVRLDDMRTSLNERYATQTKAVDAAFDSQQAAMQTALAAAEKAVSKAEAAAEKRFDSVNEFRQQLGDQAATFMPRAETEAAMRRYDERIRELSGLAASQVSRAEWSAGHDRVLEQVRELTDRANKNEGRGVGLNAGWIYLLGTLAAVGTLVSLYIAFRTGG